MLTRIDLGYRARRQFYAFHMRQQRWACMVAHRRAGKTVACVMDLVDAALRCELTDGRFAYVAPFYAQAKDAAWTYLKRYTAPIPGAEANESELRVDLPNGNRIRLYGADNYDRMRGSYFDGVVLDEYGDMHPAAWGEVIRPMLADRQGWAAFIGTPKGRNQFFEIWQTANAHAGEWFAYMLKASGSGLLEDKELADARRDMTPEQYEQEFECSFDAAILGAYYGREVADAERAGRITQVDIDPAFPVDTVWDLGKDDPTAIWFFQVAPDGVRVVDYYENTGFDLDHYVGVIQAKGYRQGKDWLPHDAKARLLGMKRTRVEQLIDMGRNCELVPDHTVMDGINAGRMSFKSMWFDAERCKFGIEALRQYRAEFDDKAKVFKTTPKHDWTSHAADAFRYMAMAWKALKPAVEKPKPKTDLIYQVVDGRLTANMSPREMIEHFRKKRSADADD